MDAFPSIADLPALLARAGRRAPPELAAVLSWGYLNFFASWLLASPRARRGLWWHAIWRQLADGVEPREHRIEWLRRIAIVTIFLLALSWLVYFAWNYRNPLCAFAALIGIAVGARNAYRDKEQDRIDRQRGVDVTAPPPPFVPSPPPPAPRPRIPLRERSIREQVGWYYYAITCTFLGVTATFVFVREIVLYLTTGTHD